MEITFSQFVELQRIFNYDNVLNITEDNIRKKAQRKKISYLQQLNEEFRVRNYEDYSLDYSGWNYNYDFSIEYELGNILKVKFYNDDKINLDLPELIWCDSANEDTFKMYQKCEKLLNTEKQNFRLIDTHDNRTIGKLSLREINFLDCEIRQACRKIEYLQNHIHNCALALGYDAGEQLIHKMSEELKK